MLALERATSDIGALKGDARVPLLSALAAAHAALGRSEHAMAIVMQLGEGEEHDRALARVAVALARHGDNAAAQAIINKIADDDERDWAIDEICHLFAAGSHWVSVQQLVTSIRSDEQRARTQAELALLQARDGEASAAWDSALRIEMSSERTRALTLIAPLLIAQGKAERTLAIVADHKLLTTSETRSRFRATIVAALAAAGLSQQAATVLGFPMRPLDRARTCLAMGEFQAHNNSAEAQALLGRALYVSVIGRDEAMRIAEAAAPLLGLLGGAPLLAEVAAVIDEVDNWV
jgi:hypothetical protein